MRELRSQEGDINYLYRQLQQLSRVLKEGSSLVAQKDTVTNVDEYLAACKVGINAKQHKITPKKCLLQNIIFTLQVLIEQLTYRLICVT